MRKLKLVQIAYKSEWALAKFFDAIFKNKDIQNKFALMGICGRQTDTEIYDSVEDAIEDRIIAIEKNPGWRFGNRLKEIKSLIGILKRLGKREIKYYKVNGDNTLPDKVYEQNLDVIVIHSTNPTHIDYIENAKGNKKHILCEKPLVTLIDENGEANRDQLNRLEKLVKDVEKGGDELVMIDAEHYGAKKTSLIFYEKLEDIIEKYRNKDKDERPKITNIEGEIVEIDDPEFGRTRDILSLKNRTGLLLDTGVHLFSFISDLRGKCKVTKEQYDKYQDNKVKYDVETWADVEFSIKGKKYFGKGAKGKFRVGKFIDKAKKEIKESYENKNGKVQESKYIKFDFDQGFSIKVDFKNKDVKVTDNNGYEEEITSQIEYDDNEYVNILNGFYDIVNYGSSKQMVTTFKSSLKTLNVIYQAYKKFPINNSKNQIEVYKK